MKRQATDSEKIIAKHISGQGLVLRIENKTKTSQKTSYSATINKPLNQTWARDLNTHTLTEL